MRVLVYAHHLELGGSQTNSIDLAAAARDRFDHEVTIIATPGPAAALIERKGLPLIPAPRAQHHPSLALIRALFAAIHELRPDLVHAWEWQQILDAFYGPHLMAGMPLLGSSMSMSAVRSIPRTIPLTLGAPQILDTSRRSRSGPVRLIEPPVDMALDDPEAVDADSFVSANSLDPAALRVVVVSRLVDWLKAEGIARAVDALPLARTERPLQLVIVGEGPAATMLQERADAANAALGRRAAVLSGPLDDPRPAYAAADIMLGMGGSALRGMSFAKPTIVLGELGFSEILSPETVDPFYEAGFYGIGSGDASPDRLARQLEELAASQGRRDELGGYARSVVANRYGLDVVAAELDAGYRSTVEQARSTVRRSLDAVRTLPYAVVDDLPDPVRNALRRVKPSGSRSITDPADVYSARKPSTSR